MTAIIIAPIKYIIIRIIIMSNIRNCEYFRFEKFISSKLINHFMSSLYHRKAYVYSIVKVFFFVIKKYKITIQIIEVYYNIKHCN